MNADAIIVGLGNPGPRYAFTRHNVGFIALDILADRERSSFSASGLGSKIEAHWAEVRVDGKKCLLLKPQTFMNLSGKSLQKLYQLHNHLREAQLVCLHDEADIPFGQLRIKVGGGDAGHNGLKSLRETLGHGDYARIRMGVGKPVPGSGISLADSVLAPFRKEEEATLMDLNIRTLQVLESFLSKGLEQAQRIAALP
jgi:PTH1 family peptidyl-tRNA hydrolase